VVIVLYCSLLQIELPKELYVRCAEFASVGSNTAPDMD